MKRTLAAAVTVMVGGTSIWLATTPTQARAKPPRAPVHNSATIKALTTWTYQAGGKLAVTARCSRRNDLAVVSSKMLPYRVNLRHGGSLLINVTDKTKAGKYAIALWCVPKGGRVDAIDVMSVKIMKHLSSFKQPRTPALPRHFKANATVCSGPPMMKNRHGKKPVMKNWHGKKPVMKTWHCKCMQAKKPAKSQVPVAAPTPSPSAGDQQAS